MENLQFHVVFDDLFTAVSYTKKSEVPPNWSELVIKSSEKVTNEDYELAKMFLFPDADTGDIAMQQPNPSRTFAKDSSNLVRTMLPSGHHTLLQHEIGFTRSNNESGISHEDYIPCPNLDSVIYSLPLQDDLLSPTLINLETSGLWQSPRIAALNSNNDAPAIAAYTTSTIPISSRLFTKPRP